jgi:uncharacterized membrane protein
MQKTQIQSLSDLVFGLAISIGSLSLLINNADDITAGTIIKEIVWFSIGFIILISIWLSYTAAMEDIEFESPAEVSLNMALMLLISIEPFLLNVVAFDRISVDFATMAYALNIGAILIIMGFFNHLVLRQRTRAADARQAAVQRNSRNRSLFKGAIFLVSALPLFWDITIGDTSVMYLIWVLAFVPELAFGMGRRMARKALDGPSGPADRY